MSSENPENICVVCFKNVDIYSVGNCDHMVCYECSTRMRVLCRQNDCPICRQDLPRVVFTNTVKPFSEIQNCSPLEDKKFKICFQTRKIQEAFYKLLEHCCSICPNSPPFRTFQYLNDHMKREHNLYYCDLCVEYLNIFTFERQCYTSSKLEEHRDKGDEDDKSHKGHPLCKFCDIRYVDNDALYRHLRRDHLFCHFCDADGEDFYFSSYDLLLKHFRKEHYLCEEGSCVDEKFTPVFRTDIDLRAHRASVHGRSLGRAGVKQARTLELEFTLKPRRKRPDSFIRGLHEPSTSEGAVGYSGPSSSQSDLPKLDSSDFPSLPTGSGPTPLLPLQRSSHSGGLTIQAIGRRNAPLTINDENFPALGISNDSSGHGTSLRLNINQDRSSASGCKNGPSRNLSIRVNHSANGEPNIRIRQGSFTALNIEKKSEPPKTTTNWAVISSKKPATAATPNPPSKPPPRPLLDNDFPSLHSKFSTNLNLKVNEAPKPNFVNIKKYKENKDNELKQKTSSVTVPVQSVVPETSESTSGSSKTKSKKKKAKSSNVEEKSDTAKKKTAGKSGETKAEESGTVSKEQSALASSTEPPSGKPLPKVEDWFDCLKKNVTKNESHDVEESSETEVPSSSGNSSLLDFSETTNFSSGLSSSFTKNSGNANDKKKFSKKLETKVPPGFDNYKTYLNNNDVKKPPPGFSVDFPRSNGLTFTNSSGQSYAISTAFQYTPPIDFEKRNQNLVSKVNKIIINHSDLEQFRKMSSLFRQDLLSAKDYYEHCIKAMGDTNLQEVFPELLVLLPDIHKQQELFQVYSQKQRVSQSNKNLESCVTCQQVLSKGDIEQHLAQHSMQQNFPILMSQQWTK